MSSDRSSFKTLRPAEYTPFNKVMFLTNLFVRNYIKSKISHLIDEDKNKKLKLTDSGKYYFRNGKYVLKIGDYSESFQIK